MATQIIGSLGVKLDALTAEFEKKMAQAQSSIEGIADTAKKVAQVSGVAFTAMAVGFGLLAKNFVLAASNADEMRNVTVTGFEAMSKSVVKWSKTQAGLLSRSAVQMENFAGTTQAILKPMLGSAAAATEMSKSIAILAVDLGSFFNAADDDALRSLKAGLLGQSEPLLKFGVVLNEAALKAEALRQGITKATTAMTAAEKVQLRFALIMKLTTDAQGDAIKTSEGFANVMKAIEGAIVDIQVSFGEILLPVATKIAIAFRSLVQGIRDLPTGAKKGIIAAAALATALTGAVFALSSIVAVLPFVIAGFTALGTAITGALIPALPLIGLAAVAFIGLAAALVVNTALIGALKQAWDANLGGLADKTKTVVDAISRLWEFNADLMSRVFKTAIDVIITDLNLLIRTFNAVVNAVAGNAKTLAKLFSFDIDIGGLAIPEVSRKSLSGAGGAAGEGAGFIGGLADTAAAGFMSSLKTGAELIFGGLKNPLDKIIKAIGDMIPKADEFGEALGKATEKMEGFDFGGEGGATLEFPDESKAADAREAALEANRAMVAAGTTSARLGQAATAMSNRMGAAGQVIQGAVEGFQSGGVIGAVVGALLAVLLQTKFFRGLVEVVNDVLGALVKAFDSILGPMMPMIVVLGQLVGIFVQLIFTLNPWMILLRAFATVIGMLAFVFEFIVDTIIGVFNSIVGAIGKLVRLIPVVGKDLQKFVNSFKLDEINRDPVIPAKSALGDLADSLNTVNPQMAQMGETMRDINEQLQNIPEGFKIAAARFKALDEEAFGGGVGGGALGGIDGGAAIGQTIGTNIESVVIQVLDPDEAWESLKEAAERDNFLGGGTVIGRTARLAVEGAGG